MKKILIGLITFIGLGFTPQSQTLKIGDKAHGGIVAYIDDTGKHGLICSLEDLGGARWREAKARCDNYTFMGKSDWYLPSKYELNILYVNLHKKGLGGFANTYYWTSTEIDEGNAWVLTFYNGTQVRFPKGAYSGTDFRAVRAF